MGDGPRRASSLVVYWGSSYVDNYIDAFDSVICMHLKMHRANYKVEHVQID